MVPFIDDQRAAYGVEPICAVLPIAPSTSSAAKAREADPPRRPARAQRDAVLREQSTQVWSENCGVYGVRKVWRELLRQQSGVARCTVARLMRERGLPGVRRGKKARTTVPGEAAARPADLVKRQFVATRPNELWGADLTDVATWRGVAYVAFVIDVYSRMIVGGRVSTSRRTDLALDALEPALDARPLSDRLVHHSDHGCQYLAIRSTDRLAEAGLEASVGRVGDAYDNALAEPITGLYQTEVIRRCGPWRHAEEVEFATLEWVDWLNNRRLLKPIGHIPPADYEAASCDTTTTPAMGAGVN